MPVQQLRNRPRPLRQRLRDAAMGAMIDSAEAAMIEKGYEKATMAQIAVAAGCATGTFYLYFKNKEELLQAIVTRRAQAMIACLRAALSEADDPLEKLRQVNLAFLHYVHEHAPFFRLFFNAVPVRVRALHEQLGGEARTAHDEYLHLEQDVLREAQKRGQIRADLPPAVIQQFMEAVGISFAEHFVLAETRMSVVQQHKILWGLISGGLGAGRAHGRQ